MQVTNKLLVACCLSFTFMVIELVAGYYAGSGAVNVCSIAIMSDAAHMFSDVFSFLMSALCTYLVERRTSSRYSFGYHRAETVGALLSVLVICVVTGALVLEATQRLLNPTPVDGRLMFIVAVAGIGFNLLLLLTLGHEHHHHLGGGHDHGHGHCHGHTHAHGHSHSDSHDRRHVHADGHGDDVPCCAAQPCSTEDDTAHLRVVVDGEEAHRGGSAESQAVVRQGCTTHVIETPNGHAHGTNGARPRTGHSDDSPSDSAAAGKGEQHHASCGTEAGQRDVTTNHSRRHDHAHASGHAHGHDHGQGRRGHTTVGENQNVRGAIVHVLGDILQSIGVAIAGAVIWFTNGAPSMLWVDPVCTYIFAVSVVWVTRSLVADIVHDLMEGTPENVDVDVLFAQMEAAHGVAGVHDLHVWSIGTGKNILTAHIDATVGADHHAVIDGLEHVINAHGVTHSTIQICPVAKDAVQEE